MGGMAAPPVRVAPDRRRRRGAVLAVNRTDLDADPIQSKLPTSRTGRASRKRSEPNRSRNRHSILSSCAFRPHRSLRCNILRRCHADDHAIVRLPAPIFDRSTLPQPYRLARHDVATLEMPSSSRETRLRTPIARLWSFRPQYAVGPYVLSASPLASRCDIREEPMSMLIGTRIAKQRDARELFVFD